MNVETYADPTTPDREQFLVLVRHQNDEGMFATLDEIDGTPNVVLVQASYVDEGLTLDDVVEALKGTEVPPLDANLALLREQLDDARLQVLALERRLIDASGWGRKYEAAMRAVRALTELLGDDA